MNAFNKLLTGDQLWAKAARFALVGGASTIFYGVITLVAVQRCGLSPLVATIVGYMIAIPFNYILQRGFTFRSNKRIKQELPRYLFIHGLNMAGSFGMMLLIVEVLDMDYRLGIIVNMTLVPVVVFLAMNTWVFRRVPA